MLNTNKMNLSYKIHILLTFFLLVSTIINAQTHVNEACTLANGEQGKCTKIENCPSAIKVIRSREKPVHCGFDGRMPIVCCELQKKVGEISKKKCLEYSIKPPGIYSFRNDQTDPIVSDLTLTDVINIAEKAESRRIRSLSNLNLTQENVQSAVGGVNAFLFQFPHMAALGYGEENDISWLCGGSLISDKYVLTAAHCINPLAKGPVKFVRLGDLNLKLTTDNAKPQNYGVARSIIHPGYKAPSVYNDIALIELPKAVAFDEYVRPACLQTETTINKTSWSATGWGLTSFGGRPADHLQNVALRSYTFEECQAAYESTNTRKLKYGVNATTQICAGELNKDTCQGDSGGPLQVWRWESNIDHIYVIGVTSFGKACGIGENPAIYTRVSYYIEWIESIVWP